MSDLFTQKSAGSAKGREVLKTEGIQQQQQKTLKNLIMKEERSWRAEYESLYSLYHTVVCD